jgi:hypothetical protein
MWREFLEVERKFDDVVVSIGFANTRLKLQYSISFTLKI